MNLKKLELLFIFIFLSTSVLGVTSMNPLTKGQADLLYCRIGGTCILTNLIVQNFTVENITVTNTFINSTFIVGLNDTIISIGSTIFQLNITAQACTSTDKFSSFADGTFTCTSDIDTNASTACNDDYYLDGNGLCIHFNNTVLDITKSTTYNASKIVTITGTLDDGDIDSIRIPEDGNSYNVTEDTGTYPVLTIDINFTNVINFDAIIGRVWYEGGKGHTVQLEIWRCDLEEWENYEEYTDMTNFVNIHVPIFDTVDHICNGNVSVRFDHESSGLPTHIFRIDYLALVDGFSAVTTSQHDGLGGRDNKENHPWAMPTDATRNFTGNLTCEDEFYVVNKIGIGTLTPTSELHVIGDANITGGITAGTVEASAFTIGGTPVGTSSDTYWSTAGNGDIQYSGGMVGVGVANPASALDVTTSIHSQTVAIKSYVQYAGATGQDIFAGRFEAVGSVVLKDAYGIYVTAHSDPTHNIAIFSATGNSIFVDDVMIGRTTLPTYPLTVYGNTSGITAWFENGTSATSYEVRTPTIKDYQGNMLDSLLEPMELLEYGTYGKLKRENLLDGETTTRQVQDKSRPIYYNVTEYACWNENKTEVCGVVTFTKTDYPHNITEEGTLLEVMGANDRLMISELKQENQMLKDELCLKDNTYSWCK